MFKNKNPNKLFIARFLNEHSQQFRFNYLFTSTCIWMENGIFLDFREGVSKGMPFFLFIV